jgi:hypothetical protein
MSITIRSAQTIRTRQPSLVAGLVQTFYTGIFSYDATWFAANTATSTSVVSGWNSNSLFDVTACSAQYLGYFRAPTTGTYLIRGNPDDHLLVWLGSLAVEGFVGDESASPNYLIKAYYQIPDTSNPIALTAGTDHPLRVQWGNEGGGADLLIEYSTDSGSTWNDITPHLYRDVDSTTGFFVPSGGVTLRGHTPPPPIVTDGLIAHLDAGNINSYPSPQSATWFDISGQGADASLNGTVGFANSGTSSYFIFDGDSANCITSSLSQNYQDCTLIFQPDFSYNVGDANLAYGLGVDADRTMRFGNADGSSPWSIQNPGNNADWAYTTATNYYLNGTVIPGAGNLVTGWNILGAARTNQSWGSTPYVWGKGYFSRGFKGKLAVILLYNRVLTEAEQLQNYAALRARFGL